MLERLPAYEALLAARRPDGSEPLELYTAVASELNGIGSHEAKGRASFIRDQCAGFDGKAIFQKYRSRWGFPTGDRVSLSDFRRGFLHRFRDLDDSTPDGLAAREWFLSAPEARAARRYEKWSNEGESLQCIFVREGSYADLCDELRNLKK